MKKPTVSAIAAIGKNRELGKGNELLWTIPDDLKRFRTLTKGHPVIMGRKTFESILGYTDGKPLPDRPNIVVTRSTAIYESAHSHIWQWDTQNVFVADSVEGAIAKAKEFETDEIFIIGGAQIYSTALPFTDKLYLTLIDDSRDADSFFPEYEKEFTNVVSEELHECDGLIYRWIDLVR